MGGGAGILTDGTVNATNCTFSGNIVVSKFPLAGCGGAIRNDGGLVRLVGCHFAGNQACVASSAYGGGDGLGGTIFNNGTVILDLCTFTGNSACGSPGGSYLPGSPGGNGSGGAIHNNGTLTVTRSTFAGNTANGAAAGPQFGGGYPWGAAGGSGGSGKGGAICNQGTLWLENCTLATNTAYGGAGGNGQDGLPWADIGTPGGVGGTGGLGAGGLFSSGTSTVVNVTFVGNFGSGGAGGPGGIGGIGPRGSGPNGPAGASGGGFGAIDSTGAQLYLANCILATNSPCNCAGNLGDLGHNLSSDGTCRLSGTGSMNSTDPRIVPLANNGGPTLTIALLPDSPAIDAGDTALAPATDQRGFPRPAGLAADIGAFEYGSVMPALAITPSGTNGLNLLASGNAGQSCRLLASPDLSNWVPIATNQIGSDGTFLFYDDCALGGACRFYRLLMP